MSAAGRGGSAHRWRYRPGGPTLRVAGAVILLVLAALGSAARGVTHLSTAGMLAGGADPVTFIAGAAFVAAACLVLAGVLALLVRRRRRRPEDEFARALEPVAPWWVRALVTLATLVLIALPVAALVVALRGRHGQRVAPSAPLVPVVPRPGGTAVAPGQAGAAFLLGAVAALLAAAVLVAVALWLRQRRRAAATSHDRPAAPSPLADAVAAGTAALGATAGAREAIIACYAAMEASLATAGSPRRAADTPEELLSRAEGEGIIRTPAARRLTALFREARFSPHQLADDQRQAALAALREIADDLAGRPMTARDDIAADLGGRP
jgi:Domain of unknown function (DUF4129)